MPRASKLNSLKIEPYWQGRWAKEGIYKTPLGSDKKKKYVLDMFPYPSGATMHVGHLEGYVGTDIFSRYLRRQGFRVLHPMGWDAFGLPAENYAIKTGIHPDKSTHQNIKNFRRQLISSGLSYDWETEIDTSSPEFYRWTQWLFILMFKRGLAYKKKAPVNWCPKDETVLANEQVVDGKCERCGTEVVTKELEQWFLKITAYADRLISGLTEIDWPEEVKVQQKNWIGRSEGMEIRFPMKLEVGSGMLDKDVRSLNKSNISLQHPASNFQTPTSIPVFTTRPDTLESATFIAIPGKSYAKGDDTKEKLGRFTGKYAINPVNGEKLPIWETNYIEAGYATGSIMGVPAYDQRDEEFARKYQIDIIKRKLNQNLWKQGEEKGWGKITSSYHLRDWLISRQRYWGCPIPMIYCQHCASKGVTFKGGSFKGMEGWFPVEESELPVLLPTDVDFLPHGESPIARSKSFQEEVTCPICGQKAFREVDTMDTYVDSSWYFIRFVDPKNDREFAAPDRIKQWLPVDDYVGGGHVVQHLLFARFFWKVLFDAGLIAAELGDEPFLRLRAPGWILGPDSRKMSKRWNNVVTPDEIIPKFGADTLRLYEMFMGPFESMKPWSTTGVRGTRRFLERIWKLYQDHLKVKLAGADAQEVSIKMHQTIKKVTEDIENFRYNTAIAALMEFVNTLYEVGGGKLDTGNSNFKLHNQASNLYPPTSIRCTEWDEALKNLVLLLAPFVPHTAEEIWVNILGQKFSVHNQPWPKYDADLVIESEIDIVIQVNGKLRSVLRVQRQNSGAKDEIEKLAKVDPKVIKWIGAKKIKDAIFVPGRLINFVVG